MDHEGCPAQLSTASGPQVSLWGERLRVSNKIVRKKSVVAKHYLQSMYFARVVAPPSAARPFTGRSPSSSPKILSASFISSLPQRLIGDRQSPIRRGCWILFAYAPISCLIWCESGTVGWHLGPAAGLRPLDTRGCRAAEGSVAFRR